MLFRITPEALDASQGRWPAASHDSTQPSRRRPQSIRVFHNGWIEKWLSKAHPIAPLVWFGPLVAYGLYVGATSARLTALGSVGLFLAGWLVWSFMEYLLHRFVFHMRADTPKKKLQMFMAHGYHHEFPNDKMRLVAPPLMSWSIGLPFFAIYYIVLGPDYWAIFTAGNVVGYMAYDWIHYYTHHFRPKRGLGKWLRTYHLLHHHQSPNARYGVSSPLWDIIFGTYRPISDRLPRKK